MIIYRYTNKINGKVYIGKTESRPNKRHARHFNEAQRGTRGAFYAAVRKYGWSNFTYEIIDGANSASELSYREVHHIHANNALYPTGYNLNLGYKKHNSTVEKQRMSIKANVPNTIRMKELTALSIVKSSKKLKAVSLDGTTTIIYPSMRSCCTDFDTLPEVLGQMLRGIRAYKPLHGFYIEYLDEETIKKPRIYKGKEPIVVARGKPIKCINRFTNEVKLYKSLNETTLDGFTPNTISKYLRKCPGYVNHSVFIWEYL